MIQPTPTQQAIYDYILEHVEQSGFQPSIREMALQFNMGISSVKGHLLGLQRKGVLQFTRKNRGLKLQGLSFKRTPLLAE